MGLLVLALCVAGGLPPWETVDTEVSTNCPFSFASPFVVDFRLAMEFDSTSSNNVQIAF